MVQWKDQLEGEVGRKAQQLDKLEDVSVPNFFVITRKEAAEGFSSSEEGLKVSDTLKNSIKEAYGEIGMSSEVRNSNGKAKNLVGGQRNNQLVSVRISEGGRNEYKLNVGSSELINAVESVASSYYRSAEEEHPAIIIQKMVEPGYTGSMIGDRGRALLEVVEGLGTSLEEGITAPHYYSIDRGQVDLKKKSDKQLKIKRNPINGKHKREQVKPETLPFNDEEVLNLHSKLASEGVNAKFVYKRGSFHIVDAWEAREDFQTSEDGIRVSQGGIQGEVGRDVVFNDKTLSPSDYRNAIISRKGGYTSRDAEKAREAGKPAIFSFTRELKTGQRINIDEGSVKPGLKDKETKIDHPLKSSGDSKEPSKTASEIVPMNPRTGKGLHLSPPYGKGYSVGAREAPGEVIEASNYLDSYSSVFAYEESEKVVLDTRKLEREGLVSAMDYLEADKKILILPGPDEELIYKAVEKGFEVIAVPERTVDKTVSMVESQEQKFLIRKMREL